MTRELSDSKGRRKYLTAEEVERFTAAAAQLERANVRSLCLVLAHTGCRISEALALTTHSVDLEEQTIAIQTLKQRRPVPPRHVPVPASTIDTLDLVHGLRKRRRMRRAERLWPWQRAQAYALVKAVMGDAGIEGIHASPKGLRHGFGVRAIQKTRNPGLVKKWLGHRSLETTMIYLDVIGQEERAEAQGMWE